MNIETLRHFFLWCTIINYGAFLFGFSLSLLAHAWMHRVYGRLFRVSAQQFDAINFGGIYLYKLGIVVFNLVPLIALYLID